MKIVYYISPGNPEGAFIWLLFMSINHVSRLDEKSALKDPVRTQ